MTLIGRLAAVGAVVLAIVAIGLVIMTSGSGYQVKAVFQDASQLVNGDQVQVAGSPVGSISSIKLTPDGQAQVVMSINDSSVEPLHQGTQATVRWTSLTGIANRYVALNMGPATAPKIPNNGVIPVANTKSAVDLDELFDTLNQPTRKGLQNVFQGSDAAVRKQGAAMQRAYQYLNPAIASSSVLFSELNRDTAKFTRFITANSSLVTHLSTRSSQLSGLVQNLSIVTNALATQRQNLGKTIQELPGFMGYADTTFVNLRNLLTKYLTPLVNVSKPVAPKLRQYMATLRPLAHDAVPTVEDLSSTICRPQAYCTVGSPGYDDLIYLTELLPKNTNLTPSRLGLEGATIDNLFANGKTRPGAFPVSTQALKGSTPELAVARPYAADLTGWFEGFTHPGVIDGNGGTSRIASNNVGYNPPAGSGFTNLPLPTQIKQFLTNVSANGITAYQYDRCPGSMERGALWYPQSGFPCNRNEKPTGP